jgi:hypothetical protein
MDISAVTKSWQKHQNCAFPLFFGLIGDDGLQGKALRFFWTLALAVLEYRQVAVATGNQWTEIAMIITRLLFRSRRNQKERQNKK